MSLVHKSSSASLLTSTRYWHQVENQIGLPNGCVEQNFTGHDSSLGLCDTKLDWSIYWSGKFPNHRAYKI